MHDGTQAPQAAAGFQPEFAPLDTSLSQRNGYGLARALRALPATGRSILVAITGRSREKDRRQAAEAGFGHHLVKSVRIRQIRDILQRGLHDGR